MDSVLQDISSFLRLKHCPVSREWLRSQITENPLLTGPECYEQVLKSDISQIGVYSLPNDIFPERVKGVLEGHLFLQIVSIKDIGSSFYSQLRHLEGTTNANNEVSAEPTHEERRTNIRGQRCLLLELTDGCQSIRAVEFEPVPDLSVEVPRGSKVLLKGNLELRRGVILLRSDSVTALGGSVPGRDTNALRKEELQQALQESSSG